MLTRVLCIGLVLLSALPGVCAEQDGKERPKIGLVLGGGGALGFAHVGVLKVLEENHIPIDFITGTSMGSIVGGMYACGMSPGEIEDRFLALDWWDILKDKSPHEYLCYRRKVDNDRYMGLEFGISREGLIFPPGMAYGQKLNNILSTFAINSAGVHDFDHLNIPYRAVATDLRSGESIVLSQGSLATAMRASMAVPGVFTPVPIDDMILVDGGVLNNIPVNVARAMGADIIIAVDVGASQEKQHETSDFQSLGDVVSRTYFIAQRPEQERKLADADIVIEPDVSVYSASQFHLAETIIPAGRSAAAALTDELTEYAVSKEAYARYLARQRHQRKKDIQISTVEANGSEHIMEAIVRNRISSEPGPINLPTVYEDLNRIHGLGLFQTVTYELVPEDSGGYRLVFNTREKFWGPNYLHFGMKAESSTVTPLFWSILLHVARMPLNRLNGELDLEVESGGHIRRIETEWYQPVTASGTLFIAPSIRLYNRDSDIYIGETVAATVEENVAEGRLDLGLSAFEYGELRVGAMLADTRSDGTSGFFPLGVEHQSIVAATTSLAVDQLDDPIFPTRGYHAGLSGLFALNEAGSTESFSTLQASAMMPFTRGAHTLFPRVSAGSSIGTELPFYALFDIGGIDSFAGLAPYQIFGQYYGVAQLEYRCRIARLPPALGKGLYLQLRGDAGNAWLEADHIGLDDLEFGGLAGLAAETNVGTCRLAVGKAEGYTPRLYFTIGNTF